MYFSYQNHVRAECRETYPEVIKDLRSTFRKPNTESAEQTFVWLGIMCNTYLLNFLVSFI